MAIKKTATKKRPVNSALIAITKEAKRIRAKKPSMKWTDAIKQASKACRVSGKKVSAKKLPVKKVAVKKKAAASVPVKKEKKMQPVKKVITYEKSLSGKSAARENFAYGVRDGYEKMIKQILSDIESCKDAIKNATSPVIKRFYRNKYIAYRRELDFYKEQLTKQNQHIRTLLR
jgi:hypothetical protein